jgi:hypothetical protein
MTALYGSHPEMEVIARTGKKNENTSEPTTGEQWLLSHCTGLCRPAHLTVPASGGIFTI